MMINGQAVKGAKRLTTHLLKPENERFRIIEVQGIDTSETPDAMYQAMQDMEAMGRMTQSQTGRVLYHANIDPMGHERLTPEQYKFAADALMKKLGLEDQPRIIVEHIKKGRQHAHIVVQLTDTETGTVKQLSNNYYKQTAVAKELEKTLQLEQAPRAKTGKAYTQKDHQQAKRRGQDINVYREMVQNAYLQSINGRQFAGHLKKQGYTLAKGERRSLVVLNGHGSPRSLSRDLKPIAKAKEVKEKCNDIIPHLPDVNKAQNHIKTNAGEKKKERDIKSVSNKKLPNLTVPFRKNHRGLER